ncbi:MAG: hypothetical protein L0387_18940 [Acidobacteria bacterium]|nr:hypothetical protein [Acidobacteriota bacterium]
MSSHLIPESEIARYSSSLSLRASSDVSTFQDAVRDALGNDFETLLQGSYRNDTCIRDINDVDIVALRKHTVSSEFSQESYSNTISWGDIFADVKGKLGASARFRGKVKLSDKCVKVDTDWKANVVPAVRISSYDQDPIAIYSFREAAERQNFPRLHYQRGVQKHQSTSKTFKPVVRIFKNWVANHWPGEDVAPSFYVECLIFNVPDDKFFQDLARAFFHVGYYIEANITPAVPPVVWSVAGDKDILVESEWKISSYAKFHAQLVKSTSYALGALQAASRDEATRCWRAAFNERF